jgi:hypothetical protein
MSFLIMDHLALRLAVNSPENLRRDIGDLQSQGRALSKIVSNRAQVFHLVAHIGLFSILLIGTYGLASLLLPMIGFPSSEAAILLGVITSVSSTMVNKDELLEPLINKITRLISRNELEEMDTIKSLIDTKAEMLLKGDK